MKSPNHLLKTIQVLKSKSKEVVRKLPLNEYDDGITVFDDILDSSNSKYIDQFFIRGRHNSLDTN